MIKTGSPPLPLLLLFSFLFLIHTLRSSRGAGASPPTQECRTVWCHATASWLLFLVLLLASLSSVPFGNLDFEPSHNLEGGGSGRVLSSFRPKEARVPCRVTLQVYHHKRGKPGGDHTPFEGVRRMPPDSPLRPAVPDASSHVTRASRGGGSAVPLVMGLNASQPPSGRHVAPESCQTLLGPRSGSHLCRKFSNEDDNPYQSMKFHTLILIIIKLGLRPRT